MRTSLFLLLVTLSMTACSDPPCRPNEFKVGKNCYEKNKKVDAGPETSDSDESAEADEGSSKRDASSRRDARPDSPYEDVDAAVESQPDSSRDDDVQRSDTGPACVPTVEVCDAKDNDCDQRVDEEVDESPLGEECESGGQGICAAPGKFTCFKGEVLCNASATPTPELCDGIDNDCKNGTDDGLTNKECGGSKCDADLHLKGQKCTAGSGDCQGEGIWECDPTQANNALRCTAKEKTKNACGTSCGPVPAEDCATAGDDNCNGTANEDCCVATPEVCDAKDNNCNGQVDEGGVCPVCGDSVVSASEECDPTAPGWSTWTCAGNCKRFNLYSPCANDLDCFGTVGDRKVICSQYGVCTVPCTTGGGSACPGAPNGSSGACIALLGGNWCVINSCTPFTSVGCAVGSSCVASSSSTWCLGCDPSYSDKVCSANQVCKLSGKQNFGTCEPK